MHIKSCATCDKEFVANSKAKHCSFECKVLGPPCPLCGKERSYTNVSNAKKAWDKNKPCHSCANSLKAGGQGDVKNSPCFQCGINPRHYASLCYECHLARSKKYHKEVYRWSKYGLDGPIEMSACEICSVTDDLVIDHCHDTGQFRGVLCRTCNLALGGLKENLELIKRALKYAKRTFK